MTIQLLNQQIIQGSRTCRDNGTQASIAFILRNICAFLKTYHWVKSVQRQSFFWSVFSCFGLNKEIYSVNLLIQSEYRKIRTKKNSVFGHFSHSVTWTCVSNYVTDLSRKTIKTHIGILCFIKLSYKAISSNMQFLQNYCIYFRWKTVYDLIIPHTMHASLILHFEISVNHNIRINGNKKPEFAK